MHNPMQRNISTWHLHAPPHAQEHTNNNHCTVNYSAVWVHRSGAGRAALPAAGLCAPEWTAPRNLGELRVPCIHSMIMVCHRKAAWCIWDERAARCAQCIDGPRQHWLELLVYTGKGKDMPCIPHDKV